MGETTDVERALAAATRDLAASRRPFALVGGLAVSTRAEVRFTRDLDFAVVVSEDREAEELVLALRSAGYSPVATVEQEARSRLATVRLMSPHGVKVDLLFASSGIEREAAERATPVKLPAAGDIPVARAEELLAMKVLSMTPQRLQDRLDGRSLLACNPGIDLDCVRENLRLVRERGFDRGEDLEAKLEELLRDMR